MYAGLFAFAVAAMMQSAPAANAPPTSPVAGPDPNEKICRTESVIGSRLAKHRICATRAEWEERNRQDRAAVEQAQRMIGGPCSVAGNKTGGPSC